MGSSRSTQVREIMATLGALTLKLRATRKLLALDLLQSKQEVEQWRQSLDSISKLEIKANVDWDSFSKAESEIRRWVDSLPSTDLQVGAKFVGADLNENLKELERLLKNPLKILVDDERLFELNEHFKLKERDYKQLQNVLSSPLEIKVDRSQLDNLSRDLRAIENTPQVNLRANVDLDSLRTFHEQLNRYSQGRTLELATSVSRTTLNALQNDLKSLASNLTTARVSVQIDSQLQALRSELGNLPNTRVQIGVDVNDRRLRDLESLIDRISRPQQLRLNLPSTIGAITTEISKLALSPITLPIKIAQNAISGIFTGAFEGIGKEISREFGQGISAELKNILTQKIATPDTLGRSLIQNLNQQYGGAIPSAKVPRIVRDIFAVDPAQAETDRIINKDDSAQREQKRQKKAAQIAKNNYGTVDKEVKGLEYLLAETTANSHEVREQLRPKIEAIKPLDLQRQKLVKKTQQNAQSIGSIEIESNLISTLQKNEQKNPYQEQPGLKTQTQRLQQLDSGIQRAKDRVLAGYDNKLENRKLQDYIQQKVVKANGNPQELQQLEQKMAIAKQQAEAIQSKIDTFQSKLTSLQSTRDRIATSDEKYILADSQNRQQANRIPSERIADNQTRQKELPRRKAALARQQAELKEIEQQIAAKMTASGVEPLLDRLSKSTTAANQTRQQLQAKKQERSSLAARLDTSFTSDSDYLIGGIVENVANISGVKKSKPVEFARNSNKSTAAYDNLRNQILLPATTLSKSRKGQLLDYDEVELIVHEATHAVQYGFGDINADKDKPGRTLLTPSKSESDDYKKSIEKSTGVRKTQKRRNLEKDAYVFSARNTPDIYRGYLSEYLESQYGVGGNNYTSNIDRIVPELSKLKSSSNNSRSSKQEYAARVSEIKALVDKIAYVKKALADPNALATDDLYDLAKNKIAEIEQLESQLLTGIIKLKSNIINGKSSRNINLKAKNQPSDDIWDDNYQPETSHKTRNRKQRSGKPATDADFWATQVDTNSRNFDQQYDRLTRQTEQRLHRSINETTSESRKHQQKLADFDPLGKSTPVPPDLIASAASADPKQTTPPSFNGFLSKLDRVVTKFEHSVTKFEHSVTKIGNASKSTSPPNTQEVSHDNKIGNLGSMARSGYQGLQGMESAILPFVPFGEQLKSIGKNIALPAALYAGVGMLPGGAALQSGLGGAAHNLLALPAAGAVNAVSGAVSGAVGQIPLVGAPITHAATALTGSMLEGLIALVTPIIAGKGLMGAARQGAKLALPPAPEYDYVSAGAKSANKAIAAGQSLITTEIVPHHALPGAREKLSLAPAKPTPGLDLKVGTPPLETNDISWAANARSIIKKHIFDVDKAIVNGGVTAAKNAIDRLNTELTRFYNVTKNGSTEAKQALSGDLGNIGKWKKIAKDQVKAIDYIEMDADAAGTYNPQPKSAFRKLTERYKRSLKDINRSKEGGYFDPTPAANSPAAKAIDFLNQPIQALGFLDTPVSNIFDRFKQAIGLNRKSQPPSIALDSPPISAVPIASVPIASIPADRTLMQRLQVMQKRQRQSEYSRLPDPFEGETSLSPAAIPVSNLASIEERRARIEEDQFKAKLAELNRPALSPAPIPTSKLASIEERRARIADDQLKAKLSRSLVLAQSSALTPFLAALPEELAWTNVLLQLPGQPSLPQGKPEYLHGTTIPPKPLGRPIPPPRPRNRLLAPATVVQNIPRAKVIQQIPEISDPWIEAELKGMKIEQELDFDRAMGTPAQSISPLSRLRGMLGQAGSDAKYYANGAYQQAKAAIPNTISALRNQIGTSISKGKKRFTYSPNKHNQNYLEHSRQEGEDIIEPARAALNYEMERPDLIDPAKLKTINKATEAIDTYSTLTQKDSLNNKEVAQLKQAKKDVKGYLKDLDFQFAEDFNAGSKLNYILKETGLGMLNLGSITKALVGGFAAFTGISFVGGFIAKIGNEAFQSAAKIESLRTTVGAVTSSGTKAQATIDRSTKESNKLGYNAISGLENDAGFFASTKTTALELVAPDIMSGLKSYNRVMGVSDERAKLSQMAVVQMAGKGKITAEELFGQLAESSPGAVNVLSRSMGLSVGQLRKEMESGSLNANDALPRFGNQLTAESLGSVDAASKSGAASVGRLQNSFAGLQAAVGDKIMAPTIVGLEATTTAADTLKNNIDTLGKVFAAALLSAAASAIGLSAGIGLANPVLGFLIKGLITSLPLLKTFALQTAVAYAAIEVFNTVMGSINDSSPFKSLADESEAAFAKISKGADQTTQDINKLKDEIYGKDRSVFQVIGDGIGGAFGGQTSITKKADDDTINADRILTQNEKALKRQPPELTEANRNRRSEIELELSVIRSNNANLTSKDRDKIDINNKREQELVQERSTLEKPINTRQAELQQVIKNANNIIDSPLRNPTEKASATTQLAEAEKEQRKLQEQLVSSASTLAVGLRKVGEGLQAGLAAIDLASINSKTQTYLAAAQDARNTGALAQANFADTTTNLSAKRSLQQQSVDTLKSTIYAPKNRGTVQALGVDPENVSQEQIDRLKSTVTDTRGQSLLGYLSKYQQVKTELAQTNQSIFETQYSYIKSIADYNKGLADQNIALRNSFTNLQLTARTSIVNLQQQIEQTLIEIDTNSSKAMFQAQRNKIQGAYNKFLEKLGISTDSIFDRIFENYSSVVDSIQQISERRITGKQSQNTADNRQINNETRKAQARAERDQRLEKVQRESTERQLSNPLNQSSSGANQPVNNSSTGGDNTMYRSQKSGLIIPVIGATNSRGGGYKEDTGLDIMTPIGSKVVASRSGTLEYAENGHSRQIGEDVDPTSPGFQKQKSIRIKLDNPVEYEGKQYQYQYYTHLRQIEQSIYNKGSMSRTKGSQQPIRIEAGQFLGETGTAGGGPHLHTGFSVDREQRDHLNYQQVHDVFFGTKNTSRNAVGKVSPVQQVNTPVAQSVEQAHQLQNNPGTVTSSTYTPGGGGMNGGEIDSRGNRLTRNDYAIAIPAQNRVKDQIPYGSTVKLNYGGRTVIAKVTDGGPYVPGRQMDMTTAAAKALKFNGVGEVGVTLETLPKGADPNKKYYFGEATYKPKFGKGGSVSQSEAKKAIASVVQGNKYLTLGNGVQSDTSPAPGKVIDGTGQVDIAKIRSDAAQGQAVQEQTINNQLQQQELDRKIQAEHQFSNGLIKKTDTLVNVDSVVGKEKLRQERNLGNQQTTVDRAKIQTQILKNRNLLNRELPASNRKSIDLERGAEAYNRSQNRSPYQQIDTLYQQYGGVGESATLDNSIIDSRSTIDRLKEESRVRKENILKQIQSIEAYGTGWVNTRKTSVQQIKDLKANGFKTEADSIQSIVTDNDAALGTPKARQGTITRLSKQLRDLPSDGAAVYDAIAPGASKVIADSRSVSGQYLPKTFDGGFKSEARSIIERFRVSKEALQSEFAKLDEAVSILEAEIQSKLKAAGYAPQKLDLTNPTQLALLRKVAPEQTAKLEEATLTRSQVSLAGQKLDLNAETAAARAVSIGQKGERLNVDRANTDYLATTQDGNLFTQIQVDKQRFTQGKTDLDLQFDRGAISADLYAIKLKQLSLETNTLRNAIQPLRGATTGFFDDIFKGQGVFDGLGNALRNLTINILKNFQDLISKQLGQQLFGSLAAGAGDIQGNVASGQETGLLGTLLKSVGLITPGSRPNTNAGMDIGLNQPIIPKRSEGIGSGLAGSLTGMGLNLGLGLLGLPGIPGFATGGMVTSPTLALVGEGINNEAIVPLPNGRSIPVDLKGAGESSGTGNISNAISVTIQNSGQAKETSRGDSLAIATMVRNLVTQGLIDEKRPGGLLS